jgi:hypothetical protein
MSRRMILVSLVVLVAAGAGVADEPAWFDMENCGMCKNLGSNPEMMKNISWEQHNISNGIVSVTTVPDEYLADYRKAHEAMAVMGEKMGEGEMPKMCGSCMALGMCMMKGPKQEYVETTHGDVWILTSDKPELVAELQAWAKRNQEEMAKAKDCED